MLFVQQPQYASNPSLPELFLFNQPLQRQPPKRFTARRQQEQYSSNTDVKTLEDDDNYYLVLEKSRPAPSFYYCGGRVCASSNSQPFDSYEFRVNDGKLFIRSLQDRFYKVFELPNDVDLSNDFKIEYFKSGYSLIVTIQKKKDPVLDANTSNLIEFFSLFDPTCQLKSSNTIQERRALAQASQSRKQEIERKKQELERQKEEALRLERQKQEVIELDRQKKEHEQQLKLEEDRQSALAHKRQKMLEIRENQKRSRERELQKQYQLQEQLEEQQREVANKISNLIRIKIQDGPVKFKNSKSNSRSVSPLAKPVISSSKEFTSADELLTKDIESDPEFSDTSSTTQSPKENKNKSSDSDSISDQGASSMLKNYQTSTRKTHFPPLESELQKDEDEEKYYDYSEESDSSSGMSTDSETSSSKIFLRSPLLEDVEDEEFSS